MARGDPPHPRIAYKLQESRLERLASVTSPKLVLSSFASIGERNQERKSRAKLSDNDNLSMNTNLSNDNETRNMVNIQDLPTQANDS